MKIGEWAISFGKAILGNCLNWFVDIYEACGLLDVWIGVVVLACVFTIVILPLRGGSSTGGAFGEFLMNKTNSKKSDKKSKKSKGG